MDISPRTVLVSQIHDATDVANNGHRNGTYEGISYDGFIPFLKSLVETVYHLTYIDVVEPLFNWDLRVQNAVTAIDANRSGATLSYDQNGVVSASDGRCSIPVGLIMTALFLFIRSD